MKKLFTAAILIFFTFTISAKTAVFHTENLNINVNYNEILIPGDAIFVRMNLSTPKAHRKNKNEPEKKAALQLINEKSEHEQKVIEKTQFYSLNKTKKQNNSDMLAGIPLSSWLTDGTYFLKIIFSVSDDGTKEFTLPLTFTSREFVTEVVELNEQNTAIKTDSSPERAAQIEKLNGILFTVNPANVYSLKKFISPTTSTRYTAFFGDRRIYSYSNGKTSTSLHYGNDYGIPEGSDVRACAEGKVVLAEFRNSTGFSVVIEHLPGLYSLYYHLSTIKAVEGDFVKQGEIIGKSGSTGLATGPHLHWEIRLNGAAVHPEFFMEDFAFEQN